MRAVVEKTYLARSLEQPRGYHAIYRENQTNHCPGCGRSHWYVGRVSAECGFCGTAIPLSGETK